MIQANAVKAAAEDASASQRRKRQKLAGGAGLPTGGEEGAGAGAGAETVRWMSWSSQRRAFQCAAVSCCICWLSASPALQGCGAYLRYLTRSILQQALCAQVALLCRIEHHVSKCKS